MQRMELATITPATADPIPAFTGQVPGDLRQAIGRAVDAWLLRTPSPHTRRAYRLDLDQFLAASRHPAGRLRAPRRHPPRACQPVA